MSKVTSKYQVSIPRTLASQLGVHPGDEIEWSLAGDELRISPARTRQPLSVEKRLERLEANIKKANRSEDVAERALFLKLKAALEAERPLRDVALEAD